MDMNMVKGKYYSKLYLIDMDPHLQGLVFSMILRMMED